MPSTKGIEKTSLTKNHHPFEGIPNRRWMVAMTFAQNHENLAIKAHLSCCLDSIHLPLRHLARPAARRLDLYVLLGQRKAEKSQSHESLVGQKIWGFQNKHLKIPITTGSIAIYITCKKHTFFPCSCGCRCSAGYGDGDTMWHLVAP